MQTLYKQLREDYNAQRLRLQAGEIVRVRSSTLSVGGEQLLVSSGLVSSRMKVTVQ